MEIIALLIAIGLASLCFFPLFLYEIEKSIKEKRIAKRLEKRDRENPGCIFDEFAECIGKKPGEPIKIDERTFAEWSKHIRK